MIHWPLTSHRCWTKTNKSAGVLSPAAPPRVSQRGWTHSDSVHGILQHYQSGWNWEMRCHRAMKGTIPLSHCCSNSPPFRGPLPHADVPQRCTKGVFFCNEVLSEAHFAQEARTPVSYTQVLNWEQMHGASRCRKLFWIVSSFQAIWNARVDVHTNTHIHAFAHTVYPQVNTHAHLDATRFPETLFSLKSALPLIFFERGLRREVSLQHNRYTANIDFRS